MRWLAKCADERSSDEQLQLSDECPRPDLMFAQELVRIADDGCPALAARMKSVRESRLTNQKVATRRELFRLFT